MKNDLTSFEKGLLRSINSLENTKYTYKSLMEWSTNENQVKANLREGEKLYQANGVFVAIKITP